MISCCRILEFCFFLETLSFLRWSMNSNSMWRFDGERSLGTVTGSECLAMGPAVSIRARAMRSAGCADDGRPRLR